MSQSPEVPNAEGLRAEAEAIAAALPALMLSAERLSAALLSGAHGMRRPGIGEEFWQYRAATPGDSARNIDWRRSARSDVQFVRDIEAQTAQTATLWISKGQGMDYTGDANRPTKRARAQLLALATAIALLREGEKVGVMGDSARPGRAQADRIARRLLSRIDGIGDDDTPVAATLHPGQRVLLISDFLGDPKPYAQFLSHAAALGVRGAMLQILDPNEEVFPFSGALLFRSASGAIQHDTRDADGLRQAYLARLHERRQMLSELARDCGWQFGTHDTASTPAQGLLWIASVLEA